MEALFGWVKNIIYFMLFLSVAANLLADAKYEPYIRFFAGLLLILTVVRPFLGGFHLEDQVEGMFRRFSLEAQAEDLEKEMWAMDSRRREEILLHYREAVEADLEGMAREAGVTSSEIQVEFWEEGEKWGQVRQVNLRLSGAREALAPGREIRVETVRIGEMERQDGPGDASGLDDFIGKAALRYGLEESDIRIVEPDD